MSTLGAYPFHVIYWTSMDAETVSRIITIRDLKQITGLSHQTIWRMRQTGELPEPLRLSTHRVGWLLETIEAWLEERRKEAARAVEVRK